MRQETGRAAAKRARRHRSVTANTENSKEAVLTQIVIVVKEIQGEPGQWDSNTHLPLASSREAVAAADDHLGKIAQLGQQSFDEELARNVVEAESSASDSIRVPSSWWFVVHATTYSHTFMASFEAPRHKRLTLREILQRTDTQQLAHDGARPMTPFGRQSGKSLILPPPLHKGWEKCPLLAPTKTAEAPILEPAWRRLRPLQGQRWIDLLLEDDSRMIHLLHFLLDLGFLEAWRHPNGAVCLIETDLGKAAPATQLFVRLQDHFVSGTWARRLRHGARLQARRGGAST